MKKIILKKSFSPRVYQQKIFTNCINKNSFVVIPTGLGKTIIGLMLSIFYFNKSNKKILFLAPTKPLVEQQKKSFYDFIENINDFNLTIITGHTKPEKRIDIYKENDFIFSTPQVVENDILNDTINLGDFCFCIFDEAHRCVGNYAYNFISSQIIKNNKILLLGLTASPGVKKDLILQLFENMKIESLEILKPDSQEIKKYIKEKKIEKIFLEFEPYEKKILEQLDLVYKTNLEKLKNLKLIYKNINQISKTDLLNLQKSLRGKINSNTSQEIWDGIIISSSIMKLKFGIEIFQSQNFEYAYNYYKSFFSKNETKGIKQLTYDINFREAIEKIKKLVDEKKQHPKINVVYNLVKNKNCKLILFTSYRETAISLKKIFDEKKISSEIFLGQSKKMELVFHKKNKKK